METVKILFKPDFFILFSSHPFLFPLSYLVISYWNKATHPYFNVIKTLKRRRKLGTQQQHTITYDSSKWNEDYVLRMRRRRAEAAELERSSTQEPSIDQRSRRVERGANSGRESPPPSAYAAHSPWGSSLFEEIADFFMSWTFVTWLCTYYISGVPAHVMGRLFIYSVFQRSKEWMWAIKLQASYYKG